MAAGDLRATGNFKTGESVGNLRYCGRNLAGHCCIFLPLWRQNQDFQEFSAAVAVLKGHLV